MYMSSCHYGEFSFYALVAKFAGLPATVRNERSMLAWRAGEG